MPSPPPPPPLPAAGWFPDPWTASTLRYWDGAAWTGWVAPGPPAQGEPATLPLRAGMVGLAVLLGGFVAGIVVSIPLYLLDAARRPPGAGCRARRVRARRLVLLVGEPP